MEQQHVQRVSHSMIYTKKPQKKIQNLIEHLNVPIPGFFSSLSITFRVVVGWQSISRRSQL